MKINWKMVSSAMLKVLGWSEFKMKDGKLDITEEERAKLETSLPKGIVEAAEKQLQKINANETDENADFSAEALQQMVAESTRQIVSELNARLTAKDEIIAQKDKMIEALVEEPETDPKPKNPAAGPVGVAFKPNMSLYHNKLWEAGEKGMMLPMAADSIDITDLKTEFGVYIKGEKRNIIKKLTAKTETMQYMTTVRTDDSIWRASQSSISHVMQQFVSAWTPLGKATFTPISITQRHHKINVPVTPADVIGSWLGELYDQSLTPMQMPLVKYVLDLIIDKAMEDRELLQVMTGEFVEIPEKPASGTTGQDPEKAVDGLLTILRKEYEDADTTVHFVNLEGPITEANVVDKMKLFRRSLPRELRRKPMDLLISDDLRGLYKDAYQTLFPNTKNEDSNKETLDHSLIRLAPVASLSGLNSFFVTPKDNLILLKGKNEAASVFRMQESDYDVKIFSEHSEAYGFAIKEAIVAYIDPIWVVDGYAKASDASKLLIKMLTDAGAEDVDATKLASYKTAIAAADGIADLAALQTIIDAVNAA